MNRSLFILLFGILLGAALPASAIPVTMAASAGPVTTPEFAGGLYFAPGTAPGARQMPLVMPVLPSATTRTAASIASPALTLADDPVSDDPSPPAGSVTALADPVVPSVPDGGPMLVLVSLGFLACWFGRNRIWLRAAH